MLKYRTEDAELPAARRSRPGKIIVDMCPLGSPFKDQLMHLATIIADYTRCDYVIDGFRFRMSKSMRQYHEETGRSPGSVRLTVYGPESDLRYLELIWTVLNLHLANGMDTDHDFAKSMEENCYMIAQCRIQLAQHRSRLRVGKGPPPRERGSRRQRAVEAPGGARRHRGRNHQPGYNGRLPIQARLLPSHRHAR